MNSNTFKFIQFFSVISSVIPPLLGRQGEMVSGLFNNACDFIIIISIRISKWNKIRIQYVLSISDFFDSINSSRIISSSTVVRI